MARILVTDKDASLGRALCEELSPRNWSVEITAGADTALAMLECKHYDAAVLDWGEGSGQGLVLLRELRERGIEVPVVMLAGQGGIAEAVLAVKAGAEEFIRKPADPLHLSRALVELCERRSRSPHVLASRLDLYIRQHCVRRELGLRQLGAHFRISPRYARKLLERHLGVSFRQRLLFFRLQVAKELIASTDLPLYLVAERCGFGSPGQLSLAFHRQEGLPPRRYRTMYKG
ncbi:MAG: helix-turn-helix domain-containing protein [Candidatus Latescibacteria bacterium]|nr:helix-turn-helix domain-containing protein [Candidatus Latescibacterota bacterium]